MSSNALSRPSLLPAMFDDLLKPWNQWFDDGGLISRIATLPAVNIKENGDHYAVTLAAPGLSKDDFQIELKGDVLTISSEKEASKEDKDNKFSRREYSYTSFSRSFNLPQDVKQEGIDAQYVNGELRITLPRKEEAIKSAVSKRISVK